MGSVAGFAEGSGREGVSFTGGDAETAEENAEREDRERSRS